MARQKISGQAVLRGTGHDWDHWFGIIDGFGPLPDHTARAARLAEAVPDLRGWWVQEIVVQYERKRGLRVEGQSSRGDFQVTCSKTLYVDLDEAWEKLVTTPFLGPVDWTVGVETEVPGGRIEVRRVTPGKMLRWFWFDDSGKSTVEVDFQAKDGRTAIRFMHSGLPSKEALVAHRARWKEALEALV